MSRDTEQLFKKQLTQSILMYTNLTKIYNLQSTIYIEVPTMTTQNAISKVLAFNTFYIKVDGIKIGFIHQDVFSKRCQSQWFDYGDANTDVTKLSIGDSWPFESLDEATANLVNFNNNAFASYTDKHLYYPNDR